MLSSKLRQMLGKPMGTLNRSKVSCGKLRRVGALWLAVFSLAGCYSAKRPSTSGTVPPPKPAEATKPAEVAKPAEAAKANEEVKIKYSSKYDKEFKAIFESAKKGRWEEAETEASILYEKDPHDESVQRIKDWVSQQRKRERDQAVEDKIGEINAKNAAINPTLIDLLKEKKDRGLPPRKDLRDAIERIESTPYVPESFGKTITKNGPLFDLDSTQGRMSRILEKECSVHLDNVMLEAIILNVSQGAGINFIVDKSMPVLKQTVSVNMDKVKLGSFLRFMARNFDLQFQVGDDLVWIVDGKDPKKILEETRFYRLRIGFVMPAQFGPAEVNRVTVVNGPVSSSTETTKLNKFVNDGTPTTPAIEMAIKQFFIGFTGGNTNLVGPKYLIDYERNLIVARGTQEQLELMDHIVKEFDKPIQQVLIEARFITVSKSAFRQLGMIWETGRGSALAAVGPYVGGTDYTGLLPQTIAPGLGLQETYTNVLGRRTLSATLSALEQSGESQTLSAPRLTVINNLPATISDGKNQYYYEEYTVSQQVVAQAGTSSSLVPAGKPTKLQSGAKLEVLASIGGDGKHILLALHPQVNQDVKLVDFATVSDRDTTGKEVNRFTIKLPESRTQELATRVVVESGQTVAMGGVLEREQNTFVESVPILGNIPIIGAAFRRRTSVDTPRYLLVFVTATLISESGEFVVYDDERAKK